MVTQRRDIMAQAVYLAQLEAAKGKCQCNTCKIIRKASAAMTQQFLADDGETPESPMAGMPETITLGGDE